MKVLPKLHFFNFFVLFALSDYNWPIAQFIFLNNKLNWNFGTSPKMKFLCENVVAPLWFTYICEKGRTLGKQIIRYQGVVLLKSPLGTHCKIEEHHLECDGNMKKLKFYAHSPTVPHPRKKDEPSQVPIQPSIFLA
jgi:hypothetical protein